MYSSLKNGYNGYQIQPIVLCLVGFFVGFLVGFFVGFLVGFFVGFLVGLFVGFLVVFFVGFFVGFLIGFFVGFLNGRLFGVAVLVPLGALELLDFLVLLSIPTPAGMGPSDMPPSLLAEDVSRTTLR
jgi:hypothetical protein